MAFFERSFAFFARAVFAGFGGSPPSTSGDQVTRFGGLSAGSGERSGASRRGFFRSGAGPRPARPRIDATRSAASGPDAASASGAGLRLWGRSRFFFAVSYTHLTLPTKA